MPHTQSILVTWAILTFAVWLAAAIVPGVSLKGFWGAVVVSAIFGVLNWAIGWLLFILIGVGTLGLGFLLAFLTRWLVNALLLKLTDALTDRITIRGFGAALLAALVMSAVGTLGEWVWQRRAPRWPPGGYPTVVSAPAIPAPNGAGGKPVPEAGAVKPSLA